MAKFSTFSETIYKQKYAHKNGNNQKENWTQISKRVVNNVLSVVTVPKDIKKQIIQYIDELKFIPGGRYLYAAGLPYHQTQNCFLFKAQDSREGWADLLQKSALALMTGGGIGTDYSLVREEGRPIRKIKGFATGPISLAKIINEAGRYIMQGGSRRSAIWAGLKWDHPDIYKFINSKNWIKEVREMKLKDFSFPADLDMTNISILLNDEFFEAYRDDKHPMHSMASSVYWATVERMLKTSEPGFSVDVGKNKNETLRNAPCTGDTYILTSQGYRKIQEIAEILIVVWTGKQWSTTVFNKTRENDNILKVELTGKRYIRCSKDHTFIIKDSGWKKIEAQNLQIGTKVEYNPGLVKNGKKVSEAYLLAFVYGDGSFHTRYARAEVALCGKKEKLEKHLSSLPCTISRDKRNILRIYYKNHDIFRSRTKTTFPEEVYSWDWDSRTQFLAGLLDADGNDFNGKARLSSVCLDFLYGVARLCDTVGLTGIINKGSNTSYSNNLSWNLIIKGKCKDILPTHRLELLNTKTTVYTVVSVKPDGQEDVFCCDVKVEEHSFQAEGIIIGNCTEITSSDDADVCNLGSINLGKIDSLEEMKDVVECASIFLLAGTIYSDVPFAKVDEVRNKNRRIGLGLMGMHEFLLKRNQPYGINEELGKYLNIYNANQKITNEWSKKWEISKPIKTRSIAPTGTIAIVAGTTTGIEPLFCSAYKRRYLKGKEWHYQYVIDNITEKMIEQYGLHPDDIEDAYSLSEEPWRRMDFQKWVQKYVDHAISSTMNIPRWGSVYNNKDTTRDWGNLFLKYLPDLRGMTIYADGSRGGQPLQPIKYETAKKHMGEVFRESNDLCEITGAGSCGA